MREARSMGGVLVKQLPATRGYDVLSRLKALLNRIDAKSIGDILMGANAGELQPMYEDVAFECTIGGNDLLENEDTAFESVTDMYWFTYHAMIFNFGPIWDTDCAKLNHSPPFTPDETKMTPPFLAGVISDGKMSLEDLETKYSVIDVAKLNEMMIVQSNNEHKANKDAGGGDNTGISFQSRGIAGAMSQAGLR